MTRLYILSIVTGLLLFSCSKENHFDPGNLELPPGDPVSLPDVAPDDWLLAHIDVETTGLIPGYHEMVDIGIAMTTLDGEVLDTLFLRIQPDHPERLSPGAFAVNAFDTERWRELGALPNKAAVDSLVAFHKRVASDKHVLMVAYNSQFDAAFLDHLFRSSNRSWRELYYYFVLDIPSMAWILGFKDLTGQQFMQQYDVADEPHIAEQHTGITGAMKNARIYRTLVRYRDAFLEDAKSSN